MRPIESVLEANARYAESGATTAGAGIPRLQLAVVTCMDCRIDLSGPLGLGAGDALVIRNAGGIVTDDTLRSLIICTR